MPATTSSGNSKFGRNKIWCERYRNEGRREKNKLRKLLTRLNHHPNDRAALSAVTNLRAGRRPSAFGGQR